MLYSRLPERTLTSEELEILSVKCQQELSQCRKALKSEIAVQDNPPSGTKRGVWNRMTCEERVEYFLGRNPIAYLRKYIGNEAVDNFRTWWKNHLPLARYFATRYALILGVPTEHVFGDAAIGLMSALARYDSSRGAISTYAKWWIFYGVMRNFQGEFQVRIPDYLSRQLRAVQDMQRETRENGNEPDFNDLAGASGVNSKSIQKLLALYPRQETSFQQAKKFGANKVRNEDDGSVDQMISTEEQFFDQTTPPSDEALILQQDLCLLRKCMAANSLDEREAYALVRRYGLDGQEEQNLREIGDFFDLSRESARNIVNSGLRKLRRKFFVEGRG